MRRYVPFLLSLKYLRARQFRIGINLVLSSAADAIISSSRLCTRHFSETPISLRYPSIPFHFFFLPAYFHSIFHSTSLSNPVLVSTGLASFFSSKIHDTTYLIVDRCRSTSKLYCSTRHVATTDRFRNEETSGRNCDARAIDKRTFFLNCPTIISIPCTRLKRSHEVTNHYREARFSPPPFYPSPFRSISSLSFFFFPPLPSSLIESTLRSVNPSYYSGTHRKLCSLLLRNIAEGNICVLISLAPQGYSRKLRRQAINHKSLTARKETRKGSFPPSRTSFFFPPNL